MSFTFATVTNHHSTDSFNHFEVAKFLLWFILNAVQHRRNGAHAKTIKLNLRIEQTWFLNFKKILLSIVSYELLILLQWRPRQATIFELLLHTFLSISVMTLFTLSIVLDILPKRLFWGHWFASRLEHLLFVYSPRMQNVTFAYLLDIMT